MTKHHTQLLSNFCCLEFGTLEGWNRRFQEKQQMYPMYPRVKTLTTSAVKGIWLEHKSQANPWHLLRRIITWRWLSNASWRFGKDSKLGCYVGKKSAAQLAFFLPFGKMIVHVDLPPAYVCDTLCPKLPRPLIPTLDQEVSDWRDAKAEGWEFTLWSYCSPMQNTTMCNLHCCWGSTNSKSQPRKTQKHHQHFQQDIFMLSTKNDVLSAYPLFPPDPLGFICFPMHLVTVGAGAVIPTPVSSPIVLFDCSNLQNVPNMFKTHGIWMPLLILRQHHYTMFCSLDNIEWFTTSHDLFGFLYWQDPARPVESHECTSFRIEHVFLPRNPQWYWNESSNRKKKNCTHQPHLFGIPSKLVGWPNAEEDDGKTENQMVDWWDFRLDCWLAEVWVEVFSVPCKRCVVLIFL